MASSAFSFHCMICFEEFDTHTNYPVVLPCGHTYVCVECANRLDKCMECRMSLTMKLDVVPPTPTGDQSSSSSSHPQPQPLSQMRDDIPSPDQSALQQQKENQSNRYADRVRNSPGWRRRYGHLEEYENKVHGGYGGSGSGSGGGTNNFHNNNVRSPRHPPPPVPKIRLPLPKNAVLLSLIQASEPARRRAEVEAPATPQRGSEYNNNQPRTTTTTSHSLFGGESPRFPSSSTITTGGGTLPGSSRPTPLFHNNDSGTGGEHHHHQVIDHTNSNTFGTTSGQHHLLGASSSVDDEEHKIRVGTYLEGGPCGTYAVAVRAGLLVYPTLFEHTLPTSVRQQGINNPLCGVGDYDADAVTRDVEKVMKNYYKESAAAAGMKDRKRLADSTTATAATTTTTDDAQQQQPGSNDKEGVKSPSFAEWTKPLSTGDSPGRSSTPVLCNKANNKSSTTPPRPRPPRRSEGTPPLTTKLVQQHNENNNSNAEIGHCLEATTTTTTTTNSIKLVESQEDENVEAQHCCISEMMSMNDTSLHTTTDLAGDNIDLPPEFEEDEEEDDNSNGEEEEKREEGCDDDNIMTLSDSTKGGGEVGFSSSATTFGSGETDGTRISSPHMSGDDDDDVMDGGEAIDDYDVGVGLSVSYNAISKDSDDDDDVDDEHGDSLSDIGPSGSTGRAPYSPRLRPQGFYSRSSSDVGTSPATVETKSMKKLARQLSQGAVSLSAQKKKSLDLLDEFERPLIRLKYGDRVQVVSMDSRGWVKLARGYGYIRLENDKQLVKVGGTSDKACQIEAMLHELSIERNRLKHDQMKLERLSAGLMIDLQSSLLTSDDHVVVSAPEGLLRSESEVSLLPHRRSESDRLGSSRKVPPPTAVSLDDIEVSARSPPDSDNRGGYSTQQLQLQRELRTAKSHSPGRSQSLLKCETPPSPPYGQMQGNPNLNTPTRVNFRTGLSGHRALTSSHSHPHDFIGTPTIRSMSNHMGISTTTAKKSDRRGRSIY